MKRNFICGDENNSVLLNKFMEGLVDSNVKNYKDDLNYDFKALKLNGKEHKSFLWFLRSAGTNLMIENFVHVKGTIHNSTFNYYKDSNIKVYRIVITKVCPKNIYGYIEKINIKKYINEEKQKDKEYKNVKVRLLLKDKTKIEDLVEFTEKCYYEVLAKLNIKDEDVVRFEHLAYI